MQRLRESVDADRTQNIGEATTYKSIQNHFEIECAMCGEHFFVDKQKYAQFSRAVCEGSDNPFVCLECEREYDELAFEK